MHQDENIYLGGQINLPNIVSVLLEFIEIGGSLNAIKIRRAVSILCTHKDANTT